MIILIDNYDSFTYNLVHFLGELGAECDVYRNDQITVDEVIDKKPQAIVLSPGPCDPDQAGICLELVKRAGPEIPLLGVCLGHQCIGAAFGGRVIRAQEPMHGRSSMLTHDNIGLFQDMPQPLRVARYHSLIVADTLHLERNLRVTARSEKGEIMALSHRTHPTHGVQFHPESVLSERGHDIFRNFFQLASYWRAHAVA